MQILLDPPPSFHAPNGVQDKVREVCTRLDRQNLRAYCLKLTSDLKQVGAHY